MFELTSLIKRNIKIFIKDKGTVFMSSLSVIIMLALYFLFLNNIYASELTNFSLDQKLVTYLVTSQMMGGVLVVNTITLSLGMMSNIISDNYYNKIDSFLVTPIKRYKITLAYYISAIILTSILTLVMWLFTILYILITTSYLFPISTILIVSLLIILFTIISTSILMLIITFIKSSSAFGAFSGIFGTIVGFTSGIYMPLAILPKFIVTISSFIPFTHMTILLKQQILKDPYSKLSALIPQDAFDSVKLNFGSNNLKFFNQDVNMFVIFAAILILTIAIFLITVKRMSKNLNK